MQSEAKPTVGRTFEQNGFVYRSIRTETHVFIHTAKGRWFLFGSIDAPRGQIEIYSVNRRNKLERFEGYAVGSNFDRLYACFEAITRSNAMFPAARAAIERPRGQEAQAS